MPSNLARTLILLLILTILGGCAGGSSPVGSTSLPEPSAQPETGVQLNAPWPADIPQDAVQPWESLNSAGMIEPAGSARTASALYPESEFVTGVQRYAGGGDIVDNGEASSLVSAGGSLSYAIYRIPLGGDEPGLISVDANTLSGDGYFIGTADYSTGAWDWHGPFSDNLTRLSVVAPGATADFTSELGSVFVCVVAYDGTECDVVGVAVDPLDGADAEAPPAPQAPTVTAVAGALQLEWLPVAAGDLAGYRIYHNSQWFFDGIGTGVRVEENLEGLTSFVLPAYSEETFVRISAVDVSGNESALSDIVSAESIVGSTLPLEVSVSAPSAALNAPLVLTASGAEAYDFDIDGDGTYDITGDASGSAAVDTSSLGIIRPRVRGITGGGSSVALGGVSVVIAGNTRPVANASAAPATGIAPLNVAFTGSESMDFDGEIVGGGWDFDGDGTYDVWDDADIVHVTSANHSYFIPGIYNAKLRVVDNDGAWDVDTVAVLVIPDPDPANDPPVAVLTSDRTRTYVPFTIRFDASGSTDSDGSILLYEWDFNGDGAFEASGSSASAVHTYPVRGMYSAAVRVTDNLGASDTAEIAVTLPTEWPMYSRTLGFTGQSPYTGAQTNNVKWTYPMGNSAFCSAVIAVDGTVYVGNTGASGSLYAINPDGSLKWSYPTTATVNCTPAIADNGTIYFGGYDANFYALNPDGSLKWSTATDGLIIGGACIAPDGGIYVGTRGGGTLYSFHPDGSIRWTYPTGDEIWSAPAVDADGTVYFTTVSAGFFAVNSNGSLKWNDATVGTMRSSPGIGPDGRIYVGDDSDMFYSYSSDGTQNWALPVDGAVFGAPSFGADGNIYVPCQSLTESLYSVTPAGDVNWAFEAAGSVSTAPAIGADGVIYISTLFGDFYAVTPDGSELWSLDSEASYCESSAAIAADGTVYMADGDGELYAFGPPI